MAAATRARAPRPPAPESPMRGFLHPPRRRGGTRPGAARPGPAGGSLRVGSGPFRPIILLGTAISSAHTGQRYSSGGSDSTPIGACSSCQIHRRSPFERRSWAGNIGSIAFGSAVARRAGPHLEEFPARSWQRQAKRAVKGGPAGKRTAVYSWHRMTDLAIISSPWREPLCTFS